MRIIASGLAAAGLTLVLNVTTTAAAPITFSASGSSPAGIQATVDAYRSDLGTLNPNVAGSFGSGRREINWDGVPDAFSAPNLFPPNFFNTNSPRGVVVPDLLCTAAVHRARQQRARRELLRSGHHHSGADPRLRLRVFTDVDLANTTSLQFFDASNTSLGTFFVPAGTVASESLSFLGVDFGSNIVSRVRITSGNAALGPNEAGLDLVVMDDFLFGEPVAAVPGASTLMLLFGGLLGLGVMWRWRNA